MNKITYFGLTLGILSLIACQPGQPNPQPDLEFRSSFTGTYELYRLYQQGTVGQDTTTLFEGVEEMEVSFDPSDSMLVDPGYEKLPTVSFADRLEVALRENGRFVEIIHSSIPGNQVEGGFVEPDSVYLYTDYVQDGTFLRELITGRKIE